MKQKISIIFHLNRRTNPVVFPGIYKDRNAEYKLGLSGWMCKLYGILEDSKNFEIMSAQKPAVAIWGPSQVGKSTLLVDYIDAESDLEGNGSAIQWKESEPILSKTRLRERSSNLEPPLTLIRHQHA